MIILKNCRIFDGHNILNDVHNVLIKDNKITAITTDQFNYMGEIKQENIFNMEGYTILPGLIDAHVHLMAHQVDLNQDNAAQALVYAQAIKFMQDMVDRGFTSVRDAGGAQSDLLTVSKANLFNSPRLFISGLALSQTGGHGDFRSMHNHKLEPCSCSVNSGSKISILCDGISGVRKAAREQLRQGASQIKIMASGGVASPTDRINNLQFSEEEIRAIVEEANNFGCYVMAHAYTPKAMQRCLELGVRSLEHGNLLDDKTAASIVKHNAFLVPTLAIYEALYFHGAENGFPEESLQKLNDVRQQGLQALSIAIKHDVHIGFGTDLLGSLSKYQSTEFALRSKVQKPIEILKSATSINARLLNISESVGEIKVGLQADIIAVKGNPDTDISIMNNLSENVHLVVQNGDIKKNILQS